MVVNQGRQCHTFVVYCPIWSKLHFRYYIQCRVQFHQPDALCATNIQFSEISLENGPIQYSRNHTILPYHAACERALSGFYKQAYTFSMLFLR